MNQKDIELIREFSSTCSRYGRHEDAERLRALADRMERELNAHMYQEKALNHVANAEPTPSIGADIEGDVKHVSCQTVVDALRSQKQRIYELEAQLATSEQEIDGLLTSKEEMRVEFYAALAQLSAIQPAKQPTSEEITQWLQSDAGQARLKELAELAALDIAELDKARTVTTETLTEVYTAQLSAIRKAIEKAKANRFGQPMLVSLLELYGEAIDEIDAILSAQGGENVRKA